MRPLARLGAEIGHAQELCEIAIARIVLHEQRQCRRTFGAREPRNRARVVGFDGDQSADDRLDALLRQRLGDFENAEEIVDVGDGDGGHAIAAGQFRQLGRTDRAFEQRIGALHPQMDKLTRHGPPIRFLVFGTLSSCRDPGRKSAAHFCWSRSVSTPRARRRDAWRLHPQKPAPSPQVIAGYHPSMRAPGATDERPRRRAVTAGA